MLQAQHSFSMKLLASPSSSSSSLQFRIKNPIILARQVLIAGGVSTIILLFYLSTASVNEHTSELSLLFLRHRKPHQFRQVYQNRGEDRGEDRENEEIVADRRRRCATVEEMGEGLGVGSEKESLRVRDLIQRHFQINGATRIRRLPSYQFCRQGFVIGKASQAGFGNEMYKMLTAAALSVMLNRSLIIGKSRGVFPFKEYISYSRLAFTLGEVKHLWRKNDCVGKYGRNLTMRIDNFVAAARTNVLCSDWRYWKQPIIWFQGATDSMAIQFFLKNVHPGMKNAASLLFGSPESLQSRPNVFGELMRVIISPSQTIQEAVSWALNGADPDVALHMRMMTNRSIRAMQAALKCVKKAVDRYQLQTARPRIALVSDTPSFIKEISPMLTEFAEVVYFNYKSFVGNISKEIMMKEHQDAGRARDWGPAPRWVAFVDFFLASRAKHAVISGAHRRVGTTYAQLAAALAATNRYGKDAIPSNFSFFSSFQSNLLVNGLSTQSGWGHAWNRFAGPLGCRHQQHQCANTPLLPSSWWDGEWQSPLPRDIQKLQDYGVHLNEYGKVDEKKLKSYCRSRKDHVKTMRALGV